MKISIIGTGHIGQTEGTLLTKARYEVMYGTRNLTDAKLETNNIALIGTISMAANFSDILLLAIPWVALTGLNEKLGNVKGKIIIDATNPFGSTEEGLGLIQMPDGMTALQYTMSLFPEASVVKSFNTLTAGFQRSEAGRTGANRVVMPLAGDDRAAKETISVLINEMGFTAYDVGDAEMSKYIEPPRSPYSLYGEEWHIDTIVPALQRLHEGKTHSE